MKPVESRHDADCELDCPADGPLVEACQLGHPDSHRQLYDRYVDKVYRLMVRMVGSQDALDVTQQVFLQVYRTIQQFSGKSRFGTWLYRVAVNEALQYRRRMSRHRTQQLLHEPTTSDRGTYEDREALELALTKIAPDLRLIFLLREVDQLSYAKLAEILEITSGTVASRLNRARKQLKEELTKLDAM